MRIQLPESDRARERNRAGTAWSVVAHAVVILLAVQATAGGTTAPAPRDEPAPVIYHVQPAAPAPAPAAPDAGRAATSPAGPPLPAAPLEVPSAIPPIPAIGLVPDLALPARAGAPVSASDFRSSIGSMGGAPGPGLGSPTGPLAAHQVDAPARPADRTAPRYPDLLRRAGTEGSVLVRFVVDSTGRVDPTSITIVDATHPLFAAAVRDALSRASFRAAEVAGRPVAQLVEQRFDFRLDR